MTSEQAQSLELLLRFLALVLAVALLSLGAWRLRLRRTLGEPRVVVRPGRRARWLYHAAALAAAVGVVVSGLEVPLAPSLSVLALGVALAALAPGEQDSLLGSQGVQYGWHARRFADLEEWRLTGDHLRLRLFGEWVAVHAPAALHAQLREQLVAANPGRESRFQR
jgi:hypothetical protein